MKKKEMKKKTSKKKVMKRTLDLKNDREIAMDFGVKLYQKFDKMIKSIVLFGSSVKNTATSSSDVDLVVIIDDAAIQWDQNLGN
jgi:predicted nucleotidyltransferase